jgi:predicted nucleotidyltransferase
MLFRSLDAALGSTTKIRILRALMPLRSPVSGNEARMLAGVRSKNGMQAALNDLTDLGVLEREQTGRIRLFHINRDHDLIPHLQALFESEAQRIIRLRQALEEILTGGAVREHTLSIILFGSNARGDARPGSDVDLLVVTVPGQADHVQEALISATPDLQRRFGLRISPYALPRERVRERFQDGDPLMQNVHSEGRTLYGAHFQEIVDLW